MKKLIVLGLIAGFANVAFAEDGSFTGTVDMGTNKANQVSVQRVNEQHKLTGRSKANNGGIMVSGEKQAPKIILPGRRGD
ncbi:hypothetical protein [Vibrio caribbeanicus]|uniref:Uncharacterized protein n=1 Tax=Vibrio caribbeanicus ATCC BAA-2122 TaxID=796620 RepID=E3BES7_9VIBR|nr:hypothetical protein [Vibrio caribbeanicus]EFP98444.1 hypothetical protein VIBC2010_16064 [Vibrio caribbeanicus ATCC BAA-2122]MCY9843851.1 hypothetical protein [Vibrio caribbeanicus]